MSKKVLALVLALVMVIAMLPTVAFAADFADTTGHWAEAQIDRWTDAGVVGGDGTGFNPNGNMTRAEAAKTFASLLKLTKKAPLTAYTDVPTETWKVDALAMAVEKGIINGMSATTLVPDGTLTREQMFVMIGRALGVQPVQTATKTFADGAQTSPWAEGYINALANMGVIHGVGENKLNPTGDINRASVMTALDNLIGGYANEDGQTVEIVEGKITLIVADDVKVTGTADPDVPIVVAGAAKTVDLEGVTVTGEEAPVVQVQVSDVKVENAPTGTSVTASEGATGVTANGAAVEAGGEAVEAPAPETETQTGTQTQTPTPVPQQPQTTTYKVTIENNVSGANVTVEPGEDVEPGKTVTITVTGVAADEPINVTATRANGSVADFKETTQNSQGTGGSGGSQGPTTQGPTTQGPTTQGPTTQGPTTQGPTSGKPGTQGNGRSWTFTMPAADVTVTVSPASTDVG